MKITLDEAKNLSNSALAKLGFSQSDATVVTQNLIESEIAGKSAHGLNKIKVIKNVLTHTFDTTEKYFDYINLDPNIEIEIIRESPNHLYFDAHFRSGYLAIAKALDLAIAKAKDMAVVLCSIKDLGFASGYIGAYAQKATEKDLVYLGFHNSSGGLNYYGSNSDPLGTNPITIGIPSNSHPVIIDTSMAMINWNDIEKAKAQNIPLPENVAIDETGENTSDPNKVFSVKSIAGYKGTALAYGVELLAGALSASRIDFSHFGGWGSTFILINPKYLTGIDEFKNYVSTSMDSIKSLGGNVYIPGEKSNQSRQASLANNEIEIDENLYHFLKEFI